MTEMRRPLEGVKCVCMTMFQAGPFCFAMMADLGANVIKIEPPGTGERGRTIMWNRSFPISHYSETNNRGVKSLTLDIKEKKALEVLYKLVKDADIFAQNYRPGAAERNGFGYEDISRINPRIVYLSCSAYGPEGPDSKLPGTDGAAQAAGGICSVFGLEGTPMLPAAVSVGDQTAAFHNFMAVMIGLYHARMTGEGQKIDTSLLSGQINLMNQWMVSYLFYNQLPPRERVRFIPGATPSMSGSFADKNGKYFLMQGIGGQDWKPVMTALGCYDALTKAGLAEISEAVKSKESIAKTTEILDKFFAAGDRTEILKILRGGADVVSAPINNFADVANDPGVLANNYIISVDHPKAGKVRELGFPWRFSKTTAKAVIAPELGEHTNEILKGLGYSEAEIAELRGKKII